MERYRVCVMSFFGKWARFYLEITKLAISFWKVTNNELYSTFFLPLAGGAPSGTCASGFGVCCVFILGCGGMTNENCTFIVQAASTAIDNPCTYTICPCGSNICRIRLDFNVSVPVQPSRNFLKYKHCNFFQTFSIAGPQTGQTLTVGNLIQNTGEVWLQAQRKSRKSIVAAWSFLCMQGDLSATAQLTLFP